VNADLIDTIMIKVSSPMWVTAIDLGLFFTLMSSNWELVGDVNPAGGGGAFACHVPDTSQPFADPSNMAAQSSSQQLQDALQVLFGDSETDASGEPVPIARRNLNIGSGGPGDPTFTIPTLTFLLMCATSPSVARDLALLLDIDAPGANEPNVWDYLLVAHWCPRLPLSATGTIVSFAEIGSTDTIAQIVNNLFVESLSQLQFDYGVGLSLGPGLIWIHFPAPVQAVEVEIAGAGIVELTALSGGRIVDWSSGVECSRLLVCADSIDTVTIQSTDGTAPTVVRSLSYATEDPALDCETTACVGDIGFWMFQAHGFPVPPPPTSVVVGQLEDPSGDPEKIRAGIAWDGIPSVGTSLLGPVAYQIFRGPDAEHLDTPVAGQDRPLIVPSAPRDLPAGPGLQGPHQPWYYLDPVDDGSTLVYGVASVDVFGRLSNKTASTPVTFADNTPPASPVEVSVTVQPDGSSQLTWIWPPPQPPGAPAVVPDPDLKGFRVYYKQGAVGPPPVDGTIVTVDCSPSDHFSVLTEIDPGVLGAPGSMVMDVVRVGGDHYQVKQASAGTGGKLQLDLYRNLSTPNAIATADDTIRIFGQPWQPRRTATASDYDGSYEVADPSARTYVAAPDWPNPDDHGRQVRSFGISAYDDTGESDIAGPVRCVRVQTAVPPPPVPSSTDESDVWATPSDATGRSSYTVVAASVTGNQYHLYRALDQTLIAVDSGMRDPITGTRGGAPANPSPLTQADFDAVTTAVPPPLDRLPNRLLHALANLAGNEAAFEQLTEEPVVATANTMTYVDDSLPGMGHNRYLYRLRSAALSGYLGDFGWAYPPVSLWPQPPTRPTIAEAVTRGRFLDVNWNRSPEAEVDHYRLYVTSDQTLAADERSMTLVAEVSVDDASDPARVPNLGVTLQVVRGQRCFWRVVAVATYPPPVGTVVSAPSDSVAVTPQTFTSPAPPEASQMNAQRISGPNGTEVHISFPGDDNPTTRYMLLRAPNEPHAGSVPVTTWQQASGSNTTVILVPPDGTPPQMLPPPVVELADTEPLSTDAMYVVACTNECGQLAYSDALTVGYP
jgi:hypothetical protein